MFSALQGSSFGLALDQCTRLLRSTNCDAASANAFSLRFNSRCKENASKKESSER